MIFIFKVIRLEFRSCCNYKTPGPSSVNFGLQVNVYKRNYAADCQPVYHRLTFTVLWLAPYTYFASEQYAAEIFVPYSR